ncbi:MAG: hypothetical protein ACO23V_08155 [Chitinophagaceae bacterium]
MNKDNEELIKLRIDAEAKHLMALQEDDKKFAFNAMLIGIGIIVGFAIGIIVGVYYV